jgi:hypothetical protein
MAAASEPSELHEQILSDLNGAAKMLDQALRRLHPSLDIHKDIHRVDDVLDSVILSLQEGDYDLEAGG